MVGPGLHAQSDKGRERRSARCWTRTRRPDGAEEPMRRSADAERRRRRLLPLRDGERNEWQSLEPLNANACRRPNNSLYCTACAPLSAPATRTRRPTSPHCKPSEHRNTWDTVAVVAAFLLELRSEHADKSGLAALRTNDARWFGPRPDRKRSASNPSGASRLRQRSLRAALAECDGPRRRATR